MKVTRNEIKKFIDNKVKQISKDRRETIFWKYLNAWADLNSNVYSNYSREFRDGYKRACSDIIMKFEFDQERLRDLRKMSNKRYKRMKER